MLDSVLWFGLGVGLLTLLVIAALVLFMPRVPIRYRVDGRLVACPVDGRAARTGHVVRQGDVPRAPAATMRG